jgi:hypothetical protein
MSLTTAKKEPHIAALFYSCLTNTDLPHVYPNRALAVDNKRETILDSDIGRMPPLAVTITQLPMTKHGIERKIRAIAHIETLPDHAVREFQ